MVFKATNDTPEEVYALAKKEARRLKIYATDMVTNLNSPIVADKIPAILSNLNGYKVKLSKLPGIAGVGQYAKDQENDQTYDVIAETNAMIAAIDAGIARIQSFNTNQLISGWSASGVEWNTFSTTQTNNLKTDLQGIVNAIT